MDKKLLKLVLLSPFALFLYGLHIVCNLTTCVELWADGHSYDHMLWRFLLGFVFIFVVLGLFTFGGYALARTRSIWK